MNKGFSRVINARGISIFFFAVFIASTTLFMLQPLSLEEFVGNMVLPIMMGVSVTISFAASWYDQRKSKNRVWIALLAPAGDRLLQHQLCE